MSGGNDGNGRNKLLFWFVQARPRRLKINCCFVVSQQNEDGDSGASRQRGSSGAARRRVITREDIGNPYNFTHVTHLGADSDLSNAQQLSIVCSNF